MNTFFIAAIAAATILPSAAIAQPFGHNDRHAVVVDRRGPEHLAIGARVDPGFIARHQAVNNPARYRLARAGHDARWLKVRDDAVLVNLHTGRILNIVDRVLR